MELSYTRMDGGNESRKIRLTSVVYHNDVRKVISQQNRIGWRQLMNARFGTAWSKTQEEYYRRFTLSKWYNGSQKWGDVAKAIYNQDLATKGEVTETPERRSPWTRRRGQNTV